MQTAITPFVPAQQAKALPVCGWVPPGGCVVYQADCAPYPPNTPFCQPKPVPVSSEVTLALMVTAVIVIAALAIRRKP